MEDNKQEGDSQCVICGEKIEYYSIGICNHKQICYYCALKDRTFYNDKKCPLCINNLDIVFICPISETKTFEELKKDLSSFYKDNDTDETGVYYTDISSYEISMKLKAYKCPIDYCVKEEPFDTYEDLLHHLLECHQKFYCKVCVKDGKKFISEQKVYSKEEIKEHNLYGDFEEDIPPHHKCPFCGELYYDDEKLYRHMSNSHFMCEICKNVDKKIIFYSALPNLIQHNTLYHYCCPYKECKDILYVAFSSKKQLIQHFEDKHNQKNNNLNEKMTNENMPKIIEDPTLYDISMKKDEFNFSTFLEKVNKRCIEHRENKNKTNKGEVNTKDSDNSINNSNDKRNMNMDGVEIIYNNPSYGNMLDYDQRGFYNNRGRGRWRGKRMRRGWNDNFLMKNSFNNYIEPDEPNVNQIKIKELDYEFLTNFFLELIKKYIINYINKNKIADKEISLPKETQYQLIMIIDKINDNKKILELFNIQIFGIEWDKINKLKDFLIKGDLIDEKEFFNELDTLSLKNILVLYKYLLIANKKLNGKFYKLEMEQINENFYDNFCPHLKKEKKLNGNAAFSLNQNLNNINSNNTNNKTYKKNKNKNKWKQVEIVGLNVGKNNQKNKKKSEKDMKKSFDNYIQKCKEEDKKLEKEKEKEKDNKKDIKEDNKDYKKTQNKSKLAMLIGDSNNKNNKNVNKSKNIGEFKLSNYNLDEDFPSLKKNK